MPTAIKEEVFTITRDIVDTETDPTVVTGEGMQLIWEYEVPTGQSFVFRYEDHFAAHLILTSTSEANAKALIDVVITDSSRNAVRSLLNVIRYDKARGSASTFLAFSDKDYLNHLDITPGEEVIAREGERITVRANALDELLDASLSTFALTCHRIRHTLFD